MDDRAPLTLKTPAIVIGGVTPFTTVDFPGRLAAVLFCQGCPWRCPYCHNPHLQAFHSPTGRQESKRIPWEDVMDFLWARRGFLDGVVFSGGEPTWQHGLAEAMIEVRSMDYAIGLHTAGPDPARLARVLPLLDWVGLDIKAPLDARYDRITLHPGSAAAVRECLRLILQAGLDHQLRTTVHPDLLNTGDLGDMARSLEAMGAAPSQIQPFRPVKSEG